jgi:hypothetical protein
MFEVHLTQRTVCGYFFGVTMFNLSGAIRQHLFWISVAAPRRSYPSERSDGMFRWVYDLTNNSELSWLNVLNE